MIFNVRGWFSRARNGQAVPQASGSRVECLSSWREGDEGVIVSVEASSGLSARLQELGALPEARIRLLRSGPSTVIQIEEGRFCVRREDAASIRVARQLHTCPIG